MMNMKNYVRAQSLEEAYQLNQNRRNRIIGGMLWLKMSKATVNTAIDLCDLGLDQIEETADAFSIGAMVSLRALELHPGLESYTGGAMREALKDIVGVQFRNMATIGGSLYGRFGFSDVLTLLLLMDVDVELYHGGVVPLEQFAQMRRDRDVLVRVILRKTPGRFAYQSMRNSRTDFPVLACAAACVNGEYRLSVGARPSRARLLRDENGMLSGGVNVETAAQFADFAAENLPTGSNVRAGAAYRTHLIRVLTQRTLMELGGKENGN